MQVITTYLLFVKTLILLAHFELWTKIPTNLLEHYGFTETV